MGKDREKEMSENKQYEDDYVALDLTIYHQNSVRLEFNL